jgi:ribose transport system ATP-binding protein
MSQVERPALRVSGIKKSFGGVPVLHSVSFDVPVGHVTALAGENGAGKSTLMKIITGQLKADAGDVFTFNEKLIQGDPRISARAGVSIVPQELSPYPDLTIYENLFVGRELHNSLGLLKRSEMKRKAQEMLEVFGLNLDAGISMNQLSVAVTQLVEIVKATSWGAKILLLDEPTSAIPDREVDRLYKVVKTLRSQGVAMIYTTHRMVEIQELADSVVVLRDGNLVLDVPIKEAKEETIIRAMVGRDIEKLSSQQFTYKGERRIVVSDLVIDKKSPEVSFEIAPGEILGLGGLIGAGRTELVEAIFGIRRSRSGTVQVDGKEIDRSSPTASIKAGLAFVPEDRKGSGLVLSRSVVENASLPHLRHFGFKGWINFDQRKTVVTDVVNSVNLKSRGLSQIVGALSGGNQQKIVLARWLTQEAKLLILDEPTRGVDVGARGEIYSIIRKLADSGLSVLLVSSDMPELIGMSHRVLVIRGGGIVGELNRQELDSEDAQLQIFKYASGQISEEQHV